LKGYAIFGELHMVAVPGAAPVYFEACLAAENITENLHIRYKKWRCFNLDFCSQYRRDANKTECFVDFQYKLLEIG
jgi:hypothetical protein